MLLKRYTECFLNDMHSLMQLTGDGWYPADVSCTSINELLSKHLDGDIILGKRVRSNYISNFILDFDRDVNYSYDCYSRYVSKIIELFQCPSVIFQSSNSGNIHAWFWINWSKEAYIKSRIKGVLSTHNIPIKPKSVEIFTSNMTIRLPLGEGSHRVCQCSLDKYYEENSKDHVIVNLNKEIKQFSKVNIVNATPSYNPVYSYQKKLISKRETAIDHSDIESLIENGLSSVDTRNESCLTLIRHFYNLNNGDIQQTKQEVRDWLTQKNNGYSTLYNTSPYKALANVDFMVSNWAQKVESGSGLVQIINKPPTPLPLDVCFFIFNSFNGFKLQDKVFNLLSLLMSYDTNSEIPLSKKFLTGKESYIKLNSRNYLSVISVLEDYGVIKLINRGNNLKKSCNIYRWLGLDKSNTKVYNTYTEFIQGENLYKTFSKHIQEKYLNALQSPKT